MALKATIFKATLHVSDIDRHVYADFPLTIARHPSETDERMMVRIAAFAFNADERLTFTKGLSSTEEEPALWQKSLADVLECWIEVGLPSEDRIRKACSRAQKVLLYAYGNERNVEIWWKKIAEKLERFEHLQVIQLSSETTQALANMVKPSMDLQCTLQEGELWISDMQNSVQVIPVLINNKATNIKK